MNSVGGEALIASAAAVLLLSGGVAARAAQKAGGEIHCAGIEDCHQTAPDVVEAIRGFARILPDEQMAAWLVRAPAACRTS